MTMAYAATRHGFTTSIMDNSKKLSKRMRYMDVIWASYMASLIYATCIEEMRGPMGLMADIPGTMLQSQ